MGNEIKIGLVEKFFAKPQVAAIKLDDDVSVGDELRFKGATTDFNQKVESMQIDMKPVEKASKGASVGIKVKERVRSGDDVYKIVA